MIEFQIVTNMILSIVSVSVFGTTAIVFHALGVALSIDYGMAFSSVMLLLTLIQAVCDIWSAVICCKAVCCGRPGYQAPVGVPGIQNTQVVYTNQQQQPVYPGQQQQPVYPGQQQQQSYAVPYNTQQQPQFQYPAPAQADPVQGGCTTPPPAYTQQEQKQPPQGFAA